MSEVWVVLIKTKRAHLWRPLEVASKPKTAKALAQKVQKNWPNMCVRLERYKPADI